MQFIIISSNQINHFKPAFMIKNYRLLSAAFLCLCTLILDAQTIDSATVQKNTNGSISFARVTNTKVADALKLLKIALNATSDDSFVLNRQTKDELNMIHLRYQQYYKGIKVEGASYLLHGTDAAD